MSGCCGVTSPQYIAGTTVMNTDLPPMENTPPPSPEIVLNEPSAPPPVEPSPEQGTLHTLDVDDTVEITVTTGG